uniref:protein disulfide-isomerase n=1 Tax=Electrophorus electricus TaxID=8005 RepID=A0AAY5EIQ0_ELEEL
EELDGRFNEYRENEPWLVQFYAPWCEYCKTLDAMWYDVGAELKSSGSPVNVGKMDTSVHASEFNLKVVRRNTPLIKDLYTGRFISNAGLICLCSVEHSPAVRALTSTKLFRRAAGRHSLFFVYIGGKSPLKVRFHKAAAEFVTYTYFFSASEEVLPQEMRLQKIPSVAVFKDGTYHLYNEEGDGNLSAWVDRERFPSYLQMDSFTLYQMGERSKLVALAIVDARNPTTQSIRYKAFMESVATEYRDHYNMNFQFGYMNGNDYINGFIMGELPMPSFIVMNMSIDGYYLPRRKVEKIEDLLQFLKSILSGRSELLGGNGFLRQMKRLYYRAREVSYTANGSLTCLFITLPVAVICMIVWGTCTAVKLGDEKAADGRRKGTSKAKKED